MNLLILLGLMGFGALAGVGQAIWRSSSSDNTEAVSDSETDAAEKTPVFQPDVPDSPAQPDTPPQAETPPQTETPVFQPDVPDSPAQPDTPVTEPDTSAPTSEAPTVEAPAPDYAPDGGGDSGGDPVEPGVITPPTQSTDGTAGGETTPIAATQSIEVMAGRVATLEALGDDVASVRIVSGVEHGNITVNPDNTLALVMTTSDFTGTQGFTYEVTHSDGSTSTYQTNLNVTPGLQAGGWGTGETQYMLETDANDRVIVEHGDNHQKLYVSGSDNALTAADIASREGMSISEVTTDWLLNSQYGQSEDLALHKDIGMDAWDALVPRGSESSNWLLLEKGYEYELNDRFLVGRYSEGESELHPMYMGAFGEGERPEITSDILHQDVENLVVQDIHFSGTIMMLTSHNVLFDNIKVTDGGSAFMTSSGITVRNSEFIDNYPTEPGGDDWHAHVDRSAGVYINTTDGVLWEGNFFDHNGFGPGWETGDGAPPSMFSHNIYFDHEMTDVTLRDTITMRGASFGAQVRSGGFIEDNLFADNNAGFTTVGGDYEGAGPVGQYTLLQGNVVTYAAYKEASMIGALTWGLYDQAQMTSLVDNVVAHLADPNADESYKIWNHGGLEIDETAYYDDTVVWNWETSRESENEGRITEQNTDGLDQAVLDQTTIQLFTEQLTGIQGATTADLADYLRAQADNGALDQVVDADLINRFFQEGFGVATDIRSSAETLTFTPNEIGEGVRWDNRLNWDSNDLPGLLPGDSVDLNGNFVTYGANTTIDTLDFSDGTLNVYGGRLTATGGLEDEGMLNLDGTGQIWADGSDGAMLDIVVSDSARFANTGDMSGVDLTVNDGQAILASDGGEYDVSASHVLTVFDAARVGFDDDDGDTAILDIHAGGTVAFEASNGALGEIGEFRSGAYGDAPDVLSGIDLGGGTLSVNLSGLSAADGARFQLMSADELVGIFDDAMIDGLSGQNARVIIDYTNDTVTLELSAGNGGVSIDTVGDASEVSTGAEAVWDALTLDQGVVSETRTAMVEEESDDDLIAA